jgi:very-short-patch-repair endonuclease
MRKKWKKEEIELLKIIFPKSCKHELLKSFPDKTYMSIKMKAKKLKIRRDKETTKKIKSINVSGEKNPMFGKEGINKNKKLTQETKNKISKSLKGRGGMVGEKNPMFGKIPINKGSKLTDEQKIIFSKRAREIWTKLSESEKELRLNKLKKTRENFLKRKKETKPERLFREILEEKKIKFEPQKEVGKYVCDFLLDGKKIIEINGDYWHGNPKKYKEENLNKIQKNNINRDVNKKIFLQKEGFAVFYF